MLFGLYNEVNGGRGDWSHSNFYRQHPDWFLPPYYLVDMTNPQAGEFVHQQIGHMVRDYKIDLFRLDYNPGYDCDMGQHLREGIPENDYWRYYDNTYRLFEEVKPSGMSSNRSRPGRQERGSQPPTLRGRNGRC
jgi:hypothetical protein